MKAYLADGVYAEVGYNELVLTTDNGIDTQNVIVLDSTVLQALAVFLEANTNYRLTRDRMEM